MRRFLCILALVVLICPAGWAQLKMPAKQISVTTNAFTKFTAVSTNLQALMDWMDDNWADTNLYIIQGGTGLLTRLDGGTTLMYKVAATNVDTRDLTFKESSGGTVSVYRLVGSSTDAGQLAAGTGTVQRIIATNSYDTYRSLDLQPCWTRTYYIAPTLGWDDLYHLLSGQDTNGVDTIPRYIPEGSTLKFVFAPGTNTYSTTNLHTALELNGFYGGGSIVLESTNTADLGTTSTGKTVVLDFRDCNAISNDLLRIHHCSVPSITVRGIQFYMDYKYSTNAVSTDFGRAGLSINGLSRVVVDRCSFLGNATNYYADVAGFGVYAGGGAKVVVQNCWFTRNGWASIGLGGCGALSSISNGTWGAITSPVGLYANAATIYMSQNQPGGALQTNVTASGGYIR